MTLETLQPDPAFDEGDVDDDVLAALAADDYTFTVWGGDWCIDCERQLPRFAAVLAAGGVPDERIEHRPVTRTPSGKAGPGVEAYGIERIPTVVVERDGEEIARFVESESVPIAEYLAAELAAIEPTA